MHENLHTIRVLILEDNEDDAELMIRSLMDWGYQVIAEIIDNKNDFIKYIESSIIYDVILSDYTMFNFSPEDVQEILISYKNKTPLIIVTGTQDDKICLQLIERGAFDYIIKDRMKRLGPAVERAIWMHKLQKGLQSTLDQLTSIVQQTQTSNNSHNTLIYLAITMGLLSFIISCFLFFIMRLT